MYIYIYIAIYIYISTYIYLYISKLTICLQGRPGHSQRFPDIRVSEVLDPLEVAPELALVPPELILVAPEPATPTLSGP